MEPRKAFLASSFWLFLIIFLAISLHGVNASSSEEQHHVKPHVGPVVERDKRRTLFDTEYGEISSIDIMARHRAPPYHLQFFTLEPNSVFLPVLLHANMVLYVHTGSGRLTWADEHGSKRIDLRKGDLFKLNEGSVFYVQSNLEAERNKLRIYAMFANTDDTTYDPSIGAYSRINQLVKGFDKKIIQAAFNVPEDLIETITNKTDTPAIVHANSKEHKTFWELEVSVLNNFLGIQSNGKKGKTYNIFDKDPDFKNCHGWSLTVTKKKLKSLKGTNTGFLMVNLTTGSMLGPHWNPSATEIAVVIEGEGMVRVVSGSSNNNNNEKKVEEDKNMRFKVKEGDVFVVPRFHSMAQMSFNNDSLVFLGFSTAAKENYPQFLAGKRSVLGALDRHIVATSFGVSNTTIDQLFASQDDSIIFGCVSCAEEEERMMQEEIERKKEEEERKREEEEEAREREEEERRREKEEEEEARKQEEERERKREEEEARRQEEARKEEEARREQEQARRQQEERERKEEEEARREKERKRREEEEEEREEREQERARREEEAKREEKEAKKQQEERERKREEEEAKRKQERRREEEQEREQERERKEQEEEAQREQEKARRQQEEREKRREEEEAESEREEERRSQRRQGQREERRGEEAAAQREQEQARRQQEERETRREQEKGREKEEEAERGQGGGRKRHKRGDRGRGREEEAEWEQKEARRQQEERERRRREQQGDEVEVKGNRSSFEGRRVLKVQYV